MSNEPYQPQNTSGTQVPTPPQSSSNCLLYGCLGSVVLVVSLVVCGGIFGVYFIQGQINKYTSETAASLPIVEASEEEIASLKSQVEEFKVAVEENDDTLEPLVLTADQINALIASEEDFRGRVFIKINDGEVSGDVSIPVGKRYFNGSASFDVTLVNGKLYVNLKDAAVKGERLPQEVIDAIGAENFAKELNRNPEAVKFLEGIESLQIDGDKIVLTPKRSAPKPDDLGEAAEKTEPEPEVVDDAENPF